jgi:hypothetical protein
MTRMRRSLGLAVLAAGCAAPPGAGVDAGAAGGADAGAPPPWLGDAGLAVRAPVARPLHSLCGLASNPGDLPLGDDAASANLRAGYFAAAADLGGVAIRRDFSFSDIEPQKGSFVFTGYDELVADAEMHGVPLLATLDYGTLWAHPGAANADYPPDDPQDYASYAAAVAARYQGKLSGYEIWNEPNNGVRFWQPTLSGDPVAYGTLLADAAKAIRVADPGAPVLLGGTVFTPQLIEGAIPWLGAAYAARPDLAKSFDVAGIHAYQAYPPSTAPELGDGDTDAPLEDKIRMHAWLLAQNGGAGAPISITEIGWPVQAGAVDPAAQARYLVRATILAARSGASGIYWYTLRDGPNPTAFPPEDAFGLLDHDPDPAAGNPPSPKPAYLALRALLSIVAERWPDTADPATAGLPAGVYAVAFAGSGPGRVYAAWTADGTKSAFASPLDGAALEQDGSMRGPVKKGDMVTIGGDVTYLR